MKFINVKTWIKVLLIGLLISFIGIVLMGQYPFGLGPWAVFGLGALLVIGAIVAAASRLMGKMMTD